MTTDNPTRIHCMARGADDGMWRTWWTGERWRDWETTGGVLQGSPECVVTSERPHRLHCFARDDGGRLRQRYWVGEPEPLAEFGFDRMKLARFDGKVEINVLLALVTYADTSFDAGQTQASYESLLFGPNGLHAYFNENARDLPIRINRVATTRLSHPRPLACAHRWASCPGNDGLPMETAFVEMLQSADGPTMRTIARLDRNRDRILSSDEVVVVFVEALPPDLDNCGLARDFPATITLPGTNGVRIARGTRFLKIADRTNFLTYAHEMAHVFGARDLRAGNVDVNSNYGLMGATCGGNINFHLDPWHKVQMGFAEPQVIAIPRGRRETVRQTLHAVTSSEFAPIIFYDPDRGKNEYFMFEYRNPAVGTFDANVPGAGLVVWAVKTDANFVPVDLMSISSTFPNAGAVAVIAPPGRRVPAGGTRPWNAGDGEIALRWLDGTPSRLRFRVVAGGTGTAETLEFEWRAP